MSEETKKEHLKKDSALEEYKRRVAGKLSDLTPILQKVAMGDFSKNIVVPEKEDEFTELLASLNLMIDDLRELTESQKKARAEIEQKVKERTKELRERTKELEESRRALINMLEDVEVARKGAEEERDKTKSIITSFADGVIVLDSNNKITLINPEGKKLLGVETGEAEGEILDAFIEKPSFKVLAELIFAKKRKKSLFREELKLKDRLETIVEVTTVPIAFRKENVIILHNISREKLVEKMKTEFVSLAAHQLRTPLSAIKWTLKMLLDGDLGPVSEEQREFIEKTYKSNERMISLINDLLNVARIEEGRYVYRPAVISVKEVFKPLFNPYQEETKRRNLEFKIIGIEEEMPQIKVDGEKIRLVLQNLLDNAIRYTHPGGKVTLSFKYDKKKIEVSVQDTGVGVPEDQKGRVFTKFFRGVNVMKMETEGSGLGLFIAKNIIEAHEGNIWFESEEGKGSIFYFTIPTKK